MDHPSQSRLLSMRSPGSRELPHSRLETDSLPEYSTNTNQLSHKMNDSGHLPLRDIITHLPLELVIMTATYLSRDDIVNFLQVSKKWRSLLHNDSAMCILVKRNFPLLTSAHPIVNADAKPNYWNLFHYGVRQYYSRDHGLAKGKLEGKFTLTRDSLFRLDHKRIPAGLDISAMHAMYRRCRPNTVLTPLATTVRYSHGRIAWITRDEVLVVLDDLRTKKRALFAPPPHLGSVKLVGLGDKLVVLSAANKV